MKTNPTLPQELEVICHRYGDGDLTCYIPVLICLPEWDTRRQDPPSPRESIEKAADKDLERLGIPKPLMPLTGIVSFAFRGLVADGRPRDLITLDKEPNNEEDPTEED